MKVKELKETINSIRSREDDREIALAFDGEVIDDMDIGWIDCADGILILITTNKEENQMKVYVPVYYNRNIFHIDRQMNNIYDSKEKAIEFISQSIDFNQEKWEEIPIDEIPIVGKNANGNIVYCTYNNETRSEWTIEEWAVKK